MIHINFNLFLFLTCKIIFCLIGKKKENVMYPIRSEFIHFYYKIINGTLNYYCSLNYHVQTKLHHMIHSRRYFLV